MHEAWVYKENRLGLQPVCCLANDVNIGILYSEVISDGV